MLRRADSSDSSYVESDPGVGVAVELRSKGELPCPTLVCPIFPIRTNALRVVTRAPCRSSRTRPPIPKPPWKEIDDDHPRPDPVDPGSADRRLEGADLHRRG